MINPEIQVLIFSIAAGILLFIIMFINYKMQKSNNELRLYISRPVIIGCVSTVAYVIFLWCENHNSAVFFDSLFFIGTDWLAMCMFIFSVVYTKVCIRFKNVVLKIWIVLCSIDSISLLINNFTFHMFDLVSMRSYSGIIYWGNDFKPLHYVHLGLCYVMVLCTLFNFFYRTLTSTSFYKRKYAAILITYCIVILANCVCYTVNTPFDCSVLFYVILAGFICYYTTYGFPKKLLDQCLQAVNETVSDGIVYYDINGRCVYANTIAKRIFEKKGIFSYLDSEKYLEKWMIKHSESSSYLKGIDKFVVNGEDQFFDVEYNVEYRRDNKVGYVIKFINRTEEHIRIEREEYISTHDELTDIYNRNGFFQAVDRYIKENGCSDMVMLCSNIKDFKLINELFGDKTGDEILIKQAEIFKVCVQNGGIYGRIVDDKFALFMKRADFSESSMEYYIDKFKFNVEGSLFNMRVFVGVYEPKGRVESSLAMYDKALMAINELSTDHNKIFSYYDSNLMEKILNKKNIADDFETAIDKGQIKLYLQPVVNKDRKIIGCEALCRWKHPLRGILLPGDFIPILENIGMIYQLDEYIWEESVKLLKKWNEKGFNDVYISVNVSVKDFFLSDIYKTFTRLVDDYDVAPKNVHIELTESVLMNDFKKAFELSEKLQNFGFQVAIDNFGNGYSSLNMLKDFQADVLKIDRALLKNASDFGRSQIILETILNMAKLLNMSVIGEGVELKDQYDVLKRIDCELFQGNYFSEPVDCEEFEKKLFNS